MRQRGAVVSSIDLAAPIPTADCTALVRCGAVHYTSPVLVCPADCAAFIQCGAVQYTNPVSVCPADCTALVQCGAVQYTSPVSVCRSYQADSIGRRAYLPPFVVTPPSLG